MHAKHHERRGRRSRLLGSIFASAPKSAPLSGERRKVAHCESTTKPATRHNPASRASWRDVTAALMRSDMAEDICTRFFAEPPQDDRDNCAGRLDGGMVTAGQRLQALSNGRAVDAESGIHTSALAHLGGEQADATAGQHPESAGAGLQSLLSAKAA